MCSKVLNGHIILTDTSITTILAPEMTYTPYKKRRDNSENPQEDSIQRHRPPVVDASYATRIIQVVYYAELIFPFESHS